MTLLSRRCSDGFYGRYGKRLLDVLGAGAALIAVLPLVGMIAAAIFLWMGRPVLFSERRAGRNGTPFVLKKFRTMTIEVDLQGRLLADERRLTRLGRLLRRTSLDELPELLHVLAGEMSLVGPRPLPIRYVERYSAVQARRLEAKPGITGLAQVRGRNALSWEDKFVLDVRYVDHQSFWVDLRLLALTALVVVRGDGISQPGRATMEEFLGPVECERE